MRAECMRAASAFRLVLPGHPLAGRLGDRLGRGTGSSLEFMDYRDYVVGDDLRHVDWRAFARTDQLKVRLFREETAPSMDVLIDASPSMAVTEAKRQAALDLLAAAVHWTRRAGGRPRQLRLGGAPIDSGAELRFDTELGWLPRVPLRPRRLRLLISDFLIAEDPAPHLRRLANGASHLYVLHLLDPWELAPAADGETTLIDCESSGRLDIVLDAAAVRRYTQRLLRLRRSVERAVRGLRGTYALVRAEAPGPMFREQLLSQGIVEPA